MDIKLHHVMARALDVYMDRYKAGRSITDREKAVKMHGLLILGLAEPHDMPRDVNLLPSIGEAMQTVAYHNRDSNSRQYPAFKTEGRPSTEAEMDSSLFNNYMTFLELNKKKLLPESKIQKQKEPRWLSKTVLVARKFATTQQDNARLHDFIIGNPSLWNRYLHTKIKMPEDICTMRDFMQGALMTSPGKPGVMRTSYHAGSKLYMTENGNDILLLSFGKDQKKLQSALHYNSYANNIWNVKSEILNPGLYIPGTSEVFYNHALPQIRNFQAGEPNDLRVL